MTGPTRDTTAGRVYNDLGNLARSQGRSTDALMIDYVLERFLFRLAASPLGGRHFVLKGGLLLSQFGARRMTRDIDILGREFSAGDAEIIRRIAGIAATAVDDGVAFDTQTLKTTPIRENNDYGGLRLTMAATIARARLKVQLDVSIGDPVTPEPQTIDYPQTLAAEPFTLYGYPLATVIAEKLTTAIALGDFSTRDRDYADLYRVITLNDLDGAELTRALTATAAHRGITLQPLSASITDIATRRQSSYTAWRLRQAAASASYPDSFAEVVQLVISFSDPLITSKTATRRWTAASRAWT
jgi:hypothetical protein